MYVVEKETCECKQHRDVMSFLTEMCVYSIFTRETVVAAMRVANTDFV